MATSVYMLAIGALTVLMVSIAGVAGQVEAIEPYRDTYVITAPRMEAAGMAVGGLIFERGGARAGRQSFLRAHEYGHVLQRRTYGIAYPILVALPSVLSAWLAPNEHGDRWFEQEATDLGGGER